MAQYKVIRPFHSNQHQAHFSTNEIVNFDDAFVKEFKLDADYMDHSGIKHLAKLEKIKAPRAAKAEVSDQADKTEE